MTGPPSTSGRCPPQCKIDGTHNVSAAWRAAPRCLRSLRLFSNYASSHGCRHRVELACRASAETECASSSIPSSSPHPSRRQALRGAGALLAAAACGAALLPSGPAAAYILDEENALAVYGTAAPSVVSLLDLKIKDGREEPDGVGSGVVWDKYGHVLTNYHCISGKTIVRIELPGPDGVPVQYDASLAGSDPGRDIAVLSIDAPPEALSPITLAPSSALRVGQYVYAIGNPFGLSKTLTAGVVSGLGRTIPSPTGQRIPGAIQTDAAISAGNSGGPLLDSAGRMVGLNTATFTRSGSGRSSGVNFALPTDLLLSVVPNLILYGNASGKR